MSIFHWRHPDGTLEPIAEQRVTVLAEDGQVVGYLVADLPTVDEDGQVVGYLVADLPTVDEDHEWVFDARSRRLRSSDSGR